MTQAIRATTLRLLAAFMMLVGLTASYSFFVAPTSGVGGPIFLTPVMVFGGPVLLAVGAVLLLIPWLSNGSVSDPARKANRARQVMIFGAGMLALPAWLAVASPRWPAREDVGFLTTTAFILVGLPGLILVVAGGIVTHRSVTLWIVAVTSAFIALWIVMHRERSLVAWSPIVGATSKAAASHKLIMYEFSAEWCGPCRLMERDVFNDPAVAASINRKFVPVRVLDRQREDGKNPSVVEDLQRRFAVRSFPTIVFADQTLTEVDRVAGYRNKADMTTLIESAGASAVVVPGSAQRLDDFDVPFNWTPYPYAVELNISQDAGRTGRAMRLDFDFHSDARYATARKDVDIELPPDYQFSFWIRAEAPVNNLEFKLVDPSGKNVWWVNRREFEFPREWKKLTVTKRQIEFAWGPAGGGEPRHIGAIEIVVTAGSGGKGTVWIDDLTLERLEKSAPKGSSSVGAMTRTGGLL